YASQALTRPDKTPKVPAVTRIAEPVVIVGIGDGGDRSGLVASGASRSGARSELPESRGRAAQRLSAARQLGRIDEPVTPPAGHRDPGAGPGAPRRPRAGTAGGPRPGGPPPPPPEPPPRRGFIEPYRWRYAEALPPVLPHVQEDVGQRI